MNGINTVRPSVSFGRAQQSEQMAHQINNLLDVAQNTYDEVDKSLLKDKPNGQEIAAGTGATAAAAYTLKRTPSMLNYLGRQVSKVRGSATELTKLGSEQVAKGQKALESLPFLFKNPKVRIFLESMSKSPLLKNIFGIASLAFVGTEAVCAVQESKTIFNKR